MAYFYPNPNKTELTAGEKRFLIDSFGCKAVEGMTLLLLTEHLATNVETVSAGSY